MPRFLLLGASCLFVLARCQGSRAASPNPTIRPLVELAGNSTATVSPVPTLDPEQIALGQEVYAQHCARCHGFNLEGHPDWKTQNDDGSFRPPPHDESGHTWHHSDKLLIEAIRLGGTRLPDNIGGTSDMPAFAEVLTDNEIMAVLAYIKSDWPEDIRALQWEQTMQDQTE